MSKYKIERRDANKNYGIYRVGNCHRIVKNLKDYTDEQEAINDLVKLLDGEIKEQDLTGSGYEQDVETGKLGNRILCLEAALNSIRINILQAIGDNDKLDKAAHGAVKQINDLVERRKEKD